MTDMTGLGADESCETAQLCPAPGILNCVMFIFLCLHMLDRVVLVGGG